MNTPPASAPNALDEAFGVECAWPQRFMQLAQVPGGHKPAGRVWQLVAVGVTVAVLSAGGLGLGFSDAGSQWVRGVFSSQPAPASR